MIDMFENVYPHKKEEINNNLLKLLGFDGEDDMYLAVQKANGNTTVLSSRSSKSFKKLLEDLKNGMAIQFERNDSIVNTKMNVMNAQNELIFSSNFGFRDLDKVMVKRMEANEANLDIGDGQKRLSSGEFWKL
jgi:hypothetical protein